MYMIVSEWKTLHFVALETLTREWVWLEIRNASLENDLATKKEDRREKAEVYFDM